MRARTDADRRARDVGIATTRKDPGLGAVSELWRSFASPEHDLRRQAPSIIAHRRSSSGESAIRSSPLRVGRRIVSLDPRRELVVFDSGHVPHTTEPRAIRRAS